MDVNTKTETTYDLTGLTETQAQDLLDLCLMRNLKEGTREETLNTIRQTLLNAGVTATEDKATL